VVGVRPHGSGAPATLHPVEVVGRSGEVEIPGVPAGPLDVAVHTAAPGGVSSPAATTRVG
jgi:hypothetical protein